MTIAEIGNPTSPIGVDQAFAYCASVTDAHYENFPVASLFLPADKRPYIQAIYAFSRAADDIADEPGLTPDERLAELDRWNDMLTQCYQGEATHPVFIALRETIARQNIPIEPLRDLIAAFRRDVTQSRYETYEDLLSYCRCSANPVGRLVLMIFNQRDEQLCRLSDSICTALQLTNFWQDVYVDLQKDRLYLPREDLVRFGYSEAKWKDLIVDDTFRNLMRFQVERTRELFYEGAELPLRVEKDLQIELRLVWFGGMTILDMLRRRSYDVFRTRPSLSNFDKAWIFLRAFLISDVRNYRRKKRTKPWDLT
jgi:squalene synthase HpnC